jgi:ATP-dependent DNA ligase
MTRSLAGRRNAEATALPNWVKPQLTKLVDQPPEGTDWLHEIKFDGYRMHARLDRGAVRLLTRTGLDWTAASLQGSSGRVRRQGGVISTLHAG